MLGRNAKCAVLIAWILFALQPTPEIGRPLLMLLCYWCTLGCISSWLSSFGCVSISFQAQLPFTRCSYTVSLSMAHQAYISRSMKKQQQQILQTKSFFLRFFAVTKKNASVSLFRLLFCRAKVVSISFGGSVFVAEKQTFPQTAYSFKMYCRRVSLKRKQRKITVEK